MKPNLFLLSCALLLFGFLPVAAQPLGWMCLKNTVGDTLKLSNGVGGMLKGADGNLYFTGSYTHNVLSTHLISWNDTTWTTIDSAAGSAPVGYKIGDRLIADAKGGLYATCVSTPNPGRWQIAKWEDTAWSVLHGTGNDTLNANYIIYNFCIDTAGYVYVSSLTPTPGSSNFISRYDGSKWVQIAPDTILNDRTLALCADKLGNVYAAGYHSEGLNKFYVAKWDGSNWTKLNMGSGTFNAPIRVLYCDSLNNIYAAGSFTNQNGFQYVAKWNGISWTELGTGANALQAQDEINVIYSDTKGRLYAAGRFKNAKGRVYVAVYDGTSWSELGAAPYPLEIDVNSGGISTICSDKKGNIYAGGNMFQVNNNGLSYIAKYGDASALEVDIITAGKFNISVFPNPADNIVTICRPVSQHSSNYYLTTVNGSVVRKGTLNNQATQINISDLPPGTYLLKVGNENTYALKILKK